MSFEPSPMVEGLRAQAADPGIIRDIGAVDRMQLLVTNPLKLPGELAEDARPAYQSGAQFSNNKEYQEETGSPRTASRTTHSTRTG